MAFEAHLIKVPELLKDVKAYLKSNPGQLDWKKLTGVIKTPASIGPAV